MDSTFGNAWVESYLDALLIRGGLSAENIDSHTPSSAIPTKSKDGEAPDIAARYYVHQILSLDEDHIRDAWSKASRPSRSGQHQAERDARMEHLSWRVWTMKRRRAQVEAAIAADRKEAAAELLRQSGVEEDEDEEATTTLRTLDDLDRSSIAAATFAANLANGGFGSSALEDLDALAGLEEMARAQDGSWAVAPAKSGNAKAAAAKPPALAVGASGAPEGDHLASPFAKMPAAHRDALQAGIAPGNLQPDQRVGAPGGVALPNGTGTAPVTPTASGAVPPSTAATVQPAQPHAMSGGPDPLLVSRFPRLYIILISLHGLVRGDRMELGKDPDTGGQVKYVVELAKALGQFPSVARVDLLTRLIADPKVDKSYSEAEERLQLPPLPPGASAVAAAAQAGYGGEAAVHAAAELLVEGGTSPTSSASLGVVEAPSGAGNSSRGAFIVRLPCGDSNVYLRKEDLWPHTREFADRAIMHAQATLAKLQEGGEGPCELYVVHGHYADAGEVASMVASSLGVDCVLTGHSLGRNKKEHLLKAGNMSPSEVEATYRINRRIEAEERALDAASVVFTSTQQEVAEQWGTYDGYSDKLSSALQLRPCKGYHVPKMAVIPPGLDFSNLKVSMPSDPWEEVLGTVRATPLGSPGQSMMFKSASAAKLSQMTPMSPRLSPHNSTTAPLSGNAAPPCASPRQGSAASAAANGTSHHAAVSVKDAATATAAQTVDAVPMPAAVKAGKPVPESANGPTTPTDAGVSAGGPVTPGSVPMTPNSMGAATDIPSSVVSPAAGVPPGSPPASTPSSFSDRGRPPLPPIRVALAPNGPSSSEAGLHPTANGDTAAVAAPAEAAAGTAGQPKRHSHSGMVMSPSAGKLSSPTGGLPPAGHSELVPTHSRRTSHGEGGKAASVSATPRSPYNHGQVVDPSKLNPRALAQLMVGESEPGIWKEINRFLRHPGRPVILAMSRPDAKKNILALVRAYGQSKVLRNLANLVLIMGNRDVIDGMAPGSQRVLTDVLKLVDAYDLYGQVAYPKKHTQNDISDIYLLAAATRGVFVNIALQEPFGLTLIEAAAHGAPIVATMHGGPVDIIATLKNGVLVDPTNVRAISDALLSLITSQRTWEEYSENGRRYITAYSWPSHCARYLRTVQDQKATQHVAGRNRLFPNAGGDHNKGGAREGGRIRHTLSLSYDDLGSLAEAAAEGSNTSAAGQEGSKGGAEGHNAAAGKEGEVLADDGPHALDTNSLRAVSMPPVAIGRSGRPHLFPPAPANIKASASTSKVAALAQEGGDGAAETVAPKQAAGKLASGFQTAAMTAVTEDDQENEVPSTPGTLSKAGSGVPPLSQQPGHLRPRLTKHEHFVVFNVDTLSDVKVVAPIMKALLMGGTDSLGDLGEMELRSAIGLPGLSARAIGLGVMCTWSQKDMRVLLSNEGINPLSLDFMVCNSGALVWHAMSSDQPGSPVGGSEDPTPHNSMQVDAELQQPQQQGSGLARAGSSGLPPLRGRPSGSGTEGQLVEAGKAATSWMCDDEWEKHVDFRWDERVVLQVLRRILDNKTGWGRLHIIRASSAAADAKPAPQPAGTTAVFVRLSPKCTPYHYMVDVDVGGAVGNRQPLSLPEVAQQLLAAIKRKLRMSGLRAQLTVTPREPLPSTASAADRAGRAPRVFSALAGSFINAVQALARSGSTAASALDGGRSLTLHVTPLRCSRALALRYMAVKFRRPLESAFTMVSCASAAEGEDAAKLTSTIQMSSVDGEELVAGVQKVAILPVKRSRDDTSEVSFPVDISPFGAAPAKALQGEAATGKDSGAAPRVVVLSPRSL